MRVLRNNTPLFHNAPNVYCAFVVFILMLPMGSLAQSRFIDPREADNDYKDKNYLAAIKVYKELLSSKPGDLDYHYKLGMCYLNTNIDKAQAIVYFEFITKQVKCDNDAWYELGRAYHYANRFKEAIKAFTHYKEHAASADK